MEKEEKKNDSTPQERKKRKTEQVLDKKTWGERKTKYYWSKIDTEKKTTPRPKTPKQPTPKPPRKKCDKNLKPVEQAIEGSREVIGEASKIVEEVSICKHGLNFNNDDVFGKCYIEDNKPTQKLETPKPMTPSPTKIIAKNETLEPTTPISCEIIANNKDTCRNMLMHEITTCKRALNFTTAKVSMLNLDLNNSSREETTMYSNLQKPAIKYTKVYRRRYGCKCLSICRNLGVNFKDSKRKKRNSRVKKSIEALQKFEGFTKFVIPKELVYKIAILRGKKKMLLPMTVKVVPEVFECVLSLISSSLKFKEGRRSTKRFARANNVSKETINENGSNSQNGLKDFASCSPSNATLAGEGRKKESKRNKGHPSKTKAKRVDYRAWDWGDEQWENVVYHLTQKLEKMELYDNPKTLERWSLLWDNEHIQKLKLEEERQDLEEWIWNFIKKMDQSQGDRRFVKWNGSVLDSVVGVFLTQNVSDILSSNAYIELGSRYPIKTSITQNGVHSEDSTINSSEGSSCSTPTNIVIEFPEEEDNAQEESSSMDFDDALYEMLTSYSDLKSSTGKAKQTEEMDNIDWEAIRVKYAGEGQKQRTPSAQDSVDWEAVRNAPVEDIAKAIHGRGQHQIIAAKIKKTLDRIVHDHGSLDLEWLREAPPLLAKAYLLSFYGLGLKSVECLRLLTLHHHAFPVDVNIARVVIRLGWVPLKPLPMGLDFHLLEKYPLENEIQKYLWPRLRHLSQEILYVLHYHMITFGKVFCMKKRPNCEACPFREKCKYFESVKNASCSKFALPCEQRRSMPKSKRAIKRIMRNPFDINRKSCNSNSNSFNSNLNCLPAPNSNFFLQASPFLCGNAAITGAISTFKNNFHPIVETPPSPSHKEDPTVEIPPSPSHEEAKSEVTDIEDYCPDVNNATDQEEDIIEIKLDYGESKRTLMNCFEEIDMPLEGNDHLSRALVSLSPEYAAMPLPQHKLLARLRTEHQVYELPDYHPLLKDMDKRDVKDVLPYLLAIWLPDQLGTSGDSLKGSQGDTQEDCCAPQEDGSLTIPGTFLIPARTAMRGSFALNGTYFQVNEVFADDETSIQPLNVPRNWLWNLPKRTLYCGSSTTSIFRGLTAGEIRKCCVGGFICTRAFNRKTRGPKPLPHKFHNRLQGKSQQPRDDED